MIGEQIAGEFVFMQAQRFWIERTFMDNSYKIGMSNYQVRTYKRWYNHMAHSSLAMLFVIEQRINNKEYALLFSHNDVREKLVEQLANDVAGT